MRLIDANKLKAAIICDDKIRCGTAFQHMIVHLKNAPIIEAEPVRHGKWKGDTSVAFHGMDESDNPIYRDIIVWNCSCCGRRTVIRENYCPHCGAKMDGGNEDETD